MKSKKLTGILIAAVIILLVCVVGTTFAYYFAVLRGQNENTISTSKATLILTEQEDPTNSVQILSDELGRTMADTYDFSVSFSTKGHSKIEYALYLELSEDNTIDPELVHFYLTKNNEPAMGYAPTDVYCYNYETGETVPGSRGLGCDYSEETMAELMTTAEETTEEGKQLREISYYFFNNQEHCETVLQSYIDGEWVPYGKTSGDKCTYGSVQELYVNAPFTEENSYVDYYNKYGTGSRDLEYLPHAIYNEIIGSFGDIKEETHNYQLRYWISEEELSKLGGIEGTVNDDGSVSAEIGQDGVFKFKIAVSAKAISPS